ncbi:hypothetical protein ACOME3_007053 [Neoechinorhynchus agilis]
MQCSTAGSLIYLDTTIGIALKEAVNDLVEERVLNSMEGSLVLDEFNKIMIGFIKRIEVNARLDGELCSFRHVDDTWQITIKNARIMSNGLHRRMPELVIRAYETRQE